MMQIIILILVLIFAGCAEIDVAPAPADKPRQCELVTLRKSQTCEISRIGGFIEPR